MQINVENDGMLGRTLEKELYLELYNRLKEKDKKIKWLQEENLRLRDDCNYFAGKENDKQHIINDAIEYIQSIDEIEVRYLDKEALYRNGISEYKIQEKLEKDKSLEGHFVKVNKYYLLEILKGEDKE